MKKIMFNDSMGLTQAVLSGRKTMTRRVINYQNYKGNPVRGLRFTGSKDIRLSVEMLVYDEDCDDFTPMYIQPKYEVGEVVAIAQSYRDVAQGGYPVDSRYDAFRTANWGDGEDGALKSSAGWNNKMFVKSELMPHHIRIIDVRIERLQDISDIECFNEGIKDYSTPTEKRYGYSDFVRETIVTFKTPREAFASLIDKVSGNGTWNSNPWVFAYEFELVD